MSYTTIIPVPNASSMNTGFSTPTDKTLVKFFGPFPHLEKDCLQPGSHTSQNTEVAKLLTLKNVGPFKVTGIKPAVEALDAALDDLKLAHPALHKILGTVGMFCYRDIGNTGKPSNHAAGIALDITVGGILTQQGSKTCPMGLLILYGYMHKHGFYWGAAYNGKKKDPMHFEIASETLALWQSKGII